MSIEEKIAEHIQDILKIEEVTFDKDGEKYIAKTNSNVTLNCEQLGEIHHMGLTVFSIQKSDEELTIRFSTGGGY